MLCGVHEKAAADDDGVPRAQVESWSATRARGRRQGFTAWSSCCSARWGGGRCSRRRCATTSAREGSRSSTTWRLSPPPTLIARGRPAPAAEGFGETTDAERRYTMTTSAIVST